VILNAENLCSMSDLKDTDLCRCFQLEHQHQLLQYLKVSLQMPDGQCHLEYNLECQKSWEGAAQTYFSIAFRQIWTVSLTVTDL